MILIFGATLWLGSYLILRSDRKIGTIFVGVGLMIYAVALGCQILSTHIPESATLAWVNRIKVTLLIGLALFWIVVLFRVVRQQISNQSYNSQSTNSQSGLARRRLIGIMLVATVGFALALFGLFRPPLWLPPHWAVMGIGIDVLLLGYAIAELDAFDLGESLRIDFVRSFEGALLRAVLFGGPVALTMLIANSARLAFWLLLLVIVTIAILTQVFGESVHSLVDRIALRSAPEMQQERAELRKAAATLPRQDKSAEPDLLDDVQFVKYTRRALSHYGDLARLATSPLNRLALIERRLQQNALDDNTLTRAAELKRLLEEGVAHLKPDSELAFDSTEEWRYYNALHYPYVVGIKPYSRRALHTDLSPAAEQALAWFRQQVPERTLHNWQNAGAKLVAQYIQEIDV